MTPAAKPLRKRRGPGRALLRLHRRVGVALSALFLLVCLSGILLNHREDLPFQSRIVEAAWVYDWYGLKPQGEILHYSLSDGSVSSLDGQLYFGASSIGYFPAPVGVAELDSLNAIAFPESLLLISKTGEIIETLLSADLPGNKITQLARTQGGALSIDTDSGAFVSDRDILNWRPSQRTLAQPAAASAPPEALRQDLLSSYRGEGITWGRVLLDIHTGRFFGSMGKWVVDLAALALIFLTLTGLLYTMRYLNKARDRSSDPKP